MKGEIQLTIEQKRQDIINKSSVMMGRNLYSQGLRIYALTPYIDGNYYSDCSSFACACFLAAGYKIPWMNTTALRSSELFTTIPTSYEDGHTENPSAILKPGDLVIWYGHVEMVHHIDGADVILQGHGSGVPDLVSLYDAERYHGGKPLVRRLNELMESEEESYKTYYCVQVGAYKEYANATSMRDELLSKDIECFITEVDGFYKVQCGAYSIRKNAEEQSKKLTDMGCNNFINTKKVAAE